MKKTVLSFSILVLIHICLCAQPYYWGCATWIENPYTGVRACVGDYEYLQAPADVNVCEGDSYTLYACIPGSCPVQTYQWWWQYDKEISPGTWMVVYQAIIGETSSSISISQQAQTRQYWCVITRGGADIITNKVRVHYSANQHNITAQVPPTETVCEGEDLWVTFGIDGFNEYIWRVNDGSGSWPAISGAGWKSKGMPSMSPTPGATP